MLKKFDLVNKTIQPSTNDDNSIDIYLNPDEKEKQNILANLDFDEHTLSSALDADEVSRVEFEPNHTFIIWKHPNNYSFENQLEFNVSSLGIILTRKKIVLILTDDYTFNDKREFNKVNSLNDYFLKVLFYTIRHYTEHIRAIRLMSRELEDKISSSLENKYLIQMFNLSESLVYYLNAISMNTTVLVKLRNNAEKLGFTSEEIEFIEDLSIENNQCFKQAEIYSTVLGGLMDARGNLVNNNMTILLKRLTIINVIFLPLNLLASIGGMSEYSMMTNQIPWHWAYLLFGLGMVAIGSLTAILLNKLSNEKKSKIFEKRKIS